uniref:G domain-containing protein n=1 Tax=Panagrolaimus sp. ES5 TaxID=591445 RepID=A0AC34FBA8_9BILA
MISRSTSQAPQPSESPMEIKALSKIGEISKEENNDKTGAPKIQNKVLKSQFKSIPGAKKTFNVLLLGEVGVGKSTWINSFANYTSFDSFEDALNAPSPICLISSKFKLCKENGNIIEVQIEQTVGENSENEKFSDDGESLTQDPKTYQFETAEYIVNIIDTPGIGDVRGIRRDKENIQKILNKIAKYKDLHAICILFKANEARITASFRYCICEILLQLNRHEKIFFFFTNARLSFYKPGDTMTPLSHFLADLKNGWKFQTSLNFDNTYCIDNEAFRLLCAHFNDIKFTEEQHLNSVKSWKHSADEIRRFIKNAARQGPHQDSLSFYKARTTAFHLAKPLVDLSELIETNIKIYSDRKKDLQNTSNSFKNLEKKLKISQIRIEIRPLSHPKIVCVAQNCIETQKLGNTGQLQVLYKQICHNRCYLRGANVEQVPDPRIQGCSAMTGQKCRICGCHWSKHIHIRFEHFKTVIETDDKNIKNVIQKDEDAAKIKEQMIQDCEKYIGELKDEQNKIIKTALLFELFLDANSILPNSKAFEKYLKQKINEEEKCAKDGSDRSKIDNLKKMLDEYQQGKRLFFDHAREITVEKIVVMKTELYGLKHTGKTLMKLFEATEESTAKNDVHFTARNLNQDEPFEDADPAYPKSQSFQDLNSSSTNNFTIPKITVPYNTEINAIGIDLGTSRCCVAVIRKNGITTVPLDNTGERLLPSYVAYDEKHVKCGKIVVSRLRNYSKSTIFDSKRIIGRKLNDIEIDSFWPFTLSEKNGKICLEVQKCNGKGEVSPEEVASELLKHMKEKTEEFQGKMLTKAVITVPAAFSDAQKNGTIRAATLAGWNDIIILPEPIAAAFAYFNDRLIPNNSKILLFDSGGGTMDVCVFKIENDKIQIVSNTGDTKLGGRDFDTVLINYFKNALFSKFDILITENETVSITQEEFKNMCEPLLIKIKNTLAASLFNSKLNANQIDKVLLVGGGSRMPMIKNLLHSIFNDAELCSEQHPDEVVAVGASYYAYTIF